MKKVLMVFAALGLVLSMSGAASAASNPKLILDNGLSSGCASASEIGWVQGTDSPSDGNNSALSIRTDAGECAFAYNVKYGLKGGDPVSKAKNLSFEFLAPPDGYATLGAPRMNVDLDLNGDGIYDDTAALAGEHCFNPIGGGWMRADFTGRTAVGCDIFLVSNGTTPVASSDGTHSAWKNLALMHPTWKLYQEPYIIVDEVTNGTPAGRVLIDRIAIQNKMQQAKGNVKACKNEAAC
jgi:hypothetical protein